MSQRIGGASCLYVQGSLTILKKNNIIR